MKLVHDADNGATAPQLLKARLSELSELLQNEYDAIRERDLERITALSIAKQDLVDRINETMSRESADPADLLSAVGGDDELSALLAECRHANRVNGAAIESSQSFTTALLDILRGHFPGQRTYTARGRLGPSTRSGTLVRV